MSNSQFTFTVLGSSSATPTLFRNQSAHILHYKGINILLDCGEGAQSRMLEYKINQNKIDLVFISHLHPDHFSGLLNYICTQNLFQRTKRLLIFAPEGLEEIIRLQLQSADVIIRYPLEFINLSALLGDKVEAQIPHISYLDIKVFPLSHRIQCFGFKFTRTDEEINLIKENLMRDNLSVEAIKTLKDGKDYTDKDGNVFKLKNYAYPKNKADSFAYITDTLYLPDLAKRLAPIHTLYHESTFDSSLLERAQLTYHSTNIQAAEFAKRAGAKQLILGHFSARYKNLEFIQSEAKEIFENTYLGIEGNTFVIA